MTTDHAFDKTDLLSYFTGGTGGEKCRLIEAHVSTCGSCRDYLSKLASEKSAFLARHPFESTMVPQAPSSVPGRATHVVPFMRRRYYALAATLVLFLAAGYLSMNGRQGLENRAKGETCLKAFVQNHSGGIEKRSERIYYTGEKIQFLYSCAEANRLILLGIDTTGAMTSFYPAAGDSSCVLERGADIPLPNSIVLDEYTGREIFIAVFSKKPLNVFEVKRRVSASFAATRSLDSIDVKENNAVIVTYPVTVLQGGR
jgi:hypothetical protein